MKSLCLNTFPKLYFFLILGSCTLTPASGKSKSPSVTITPTISLEKISSNNQGKLIAPSVTLTPADPTNSRLKRLKLNINPTATITPVAKKQKMMEQALTNTTGLNLNLKPLFPSKPLEKTQLGSVSFTRLGKPLIGALDYHSIKDQTPDQVHNNQSIIEERLQIQAQNPEQMIITPEMPQDYDLEDADIENMVFEPQIILDDSNPDDYIDDTNDTNDVIENDQGDIEEGEGNGEFINWEIYFFLNFVAFQKI